MVYWNIPSIICTSKFSISFTNVAADYGFTQNVGDEFRGDQVTIKYNPGLFPKIENAPNSPPFDPATFVLTNGGVPQHGEFLLHSTALTAQVNRDIPDILNDGLAVIDMEQWGATWEQNFNSGEAYQVLSIERIQSQYPDLPYTDVLNMAIKEYNLGAKYFMSESVKLGKILRSGMKWGYYQYPQCFNRPAETSTGVVTCSQSAQTTNNNMLWLWLQSTAVYPSLYLTLGNSTVTGRAAQIRGMIQEAIRVGVYANKTLPVYSYLWYRYMDRQDLYLLDEDLQNLLKISKEEGAAGVIVWGSSNDFIDLGRCQSFVNYLNTRLGPITRRVLRST